MNLFRKIFLALLGVVLIVIIGAGYFFFSQINQPYSNDTNRNIIEIKNGEGTLSIAQLLRERNQISSDFIFTALAKIKKKPLQAGIYRIAPGSSILQVYELISTGSTTHRKITIPEGYRIEQIAQLLVKNGMTSYEDFITLAKLLEGKLFPDTYFFPLDVSTQDIVTKMREDFDVRVAGLNPTAEDLIIASIVEREAARDEERALIAGVYKNRLRLGMKLEADPTVQYGRDDLSLAALSALDKKSFKFWQPISMKDYQTVNSSYNSYIIPSLPPGPICNPGLASIRATIDYQHHDYLYFLHKDGQIYPAKTEAEHNANRAKILGAKIKL